MVRLLRRCLLRLLGITTYQCRVCSVSESTGYPDYFCFRCLRCYPMPQKSADPPPPKEPERGKPPFILWPERTNTVTIPDSTSLSKCLAYFQDAPPVESFQEVTTLSDRARSWRRYLYNPKNAGKITLPADQNPPEGWLDVSTIGELSSGVRVYFPGPSQKT